MVYLCCKQRHRTGFVILDSRLLHNGEERIVVTYFYRFTPALLPKQRELSVVPEYLAK